MKWHLLFLLIHKLQSTTEISSTKTFNLSSGFFCIYCGQPDLTYSPMSVIESKKVIDCSQPYHIYCSYEEAIGCVKYVKIIDYHIDIIKDCLRFTDLSSLSLIDIQCKSEYPLTNIDIKEKTFCCNNTHFCNQTFKLFSVTKQRLFILSHLFLLLTYRYYLIYIK